LLFVPGGAFGYGCPYTTVAVSFGDACRVWERTLTRRILREDRS
jgi:hypothetical protein